MPELPEVEATRQNLERWTEGRRVAAVVRVDPRLDAALGELEGTRFHRWERRGKVLAGLTEEGPVLVSHLGMTGRWVRGVLGPDEDRPHQRLVLVLGGRPRARRIAYLDVRRLGHVRVVASAAEAFQGLGPDAWLSPPRASALQAAMGRGAATLKERLLDQKRLAGLGNIAVSEACFRARVHPHVAVQDLPAAAWKRLVRAIRAHLEATLATTVGASEIVYVSEGGANPFLVYGRAGAPCPRCRTPITRELLQGRPTFFCPRCQPLA